MGLEIINNTEIQNNYERILFASRDGYLPQKVYDILNEDKKHIKSKYIFAGRRAYGILSTKDFLEYSTTGINDEIPFRDVLQTKYPILDLEKITKFDLVEHLNLKNNKNEILSFLEKNSEYFEFMYNVLKKEASNYYKSFISENKNGREIVFDCGYSGSVSENLSIAFGLPCDKIYLAQTDTNKEKDLLKNTITYCILKDGKYPPLGINLIYEEFFSPLQGGVVCFCNNKPKFENISFSSTMNDIYKMIEHNVKDYAVVFKDQFKSLLSFFKSLDSKKIQDNMVEYLKQDDNLALLEKMKFPDPCVQNDNYSLEKKVCDVFHFDNVFQGTGFELKKNDITHTNFYKNNFQKKIGIHLHLFNSFLIQEFLYYFIDFPYEFDLYITVSNINDHYIAQNAFNPDLIPNLKFCKIFEFENRGRDIAPWVLGMRGIQDKYDYFCHIQSKISFHFAFGNDWRKYLLKNLLDKHSVFAIIDIFENKPKVGCIFPATYKPLYEMEKQYKIHLEGMFNEYNRFILPIVKRMNIDKEYVRRSQYFSQGSMYWYRPQAFKQIFEFPLQLDEFPSEPIGVGGSLAHGFERIFPFVCEANGFEAKMYTPYVN